MAMAQGEHALDGGRASFGRQAWGDAYAQLSAADRQRRRSSSRIWSGWPWPRTWSAGTRTAPTSGPAPTMSACVWGDPVGAARCALRLGTELLLMGEMARGGGWLARARRMIEEGDLDCVERGWLLVPAAIQCFDDDPTTAHATFGQAAEIGARFGDPDLVAMARNGQGWALIRLGQTGGRRGVARRGHGCRHRRRGVSLRGRRRVLRGDRGLPGDLRPAAGAGVDGGADPLVRVAARPGPLSGAVPGVSGGDHAAAW